MRAAQSKGDQVRPSACGLDRESGKRRETVSFLLSGSFRHQTPIVKWEQEKAQQERGAGEGREGEGEAEAKDSKPCLVQG